MMAAPKDYCVCFTRARYIAAGVGIAFRCIVCTLFVCLFVRTLKGKRLELLIPNFVHIYSIAVTRHALTQRSKGQSYENRHRRTVAIDAFCYGCVLLLLAWVCMFSSCHYY